MCLNYDSYLYFYSPFSFQGLLSQSFVTASFSNKSYFLPMYFPKRKNKCNKNATFQNRKLQLPLDCPIFHFLLNQFAFNYLKLNNTYKLKHKQRRWYFYILPKMQLFFPIDDIQIETPTFIDYKHSLQSSQCFDEKSETLKSYLQAVENVFILHLYNAYTNEM